ncbi:dipeptide ABC transporter ATP-binding protein [Streptomyces zagrosensis]|uniref:Peptide/nickel transport system ATP-binding protein n=1 Tax=Streptomyces zagrosensis TaxID=1042984 RepID=A0A7W9V1E9_9ACTN|nr:ABC transporter ATP-binding protein [Streptomyces zagrosensis]MBB5937709.1 peptide/nickel transport system ATP-binding protein [Streptomyces zagrosensis]
MRSDAEQPDPEQPGAKQTSAQQPSTEQPGAAESDAVTTDAVRGVAAGSDAAEEPALLEVAGLSVTFTGDRRTRRPDLRAVREVNLTLRRGECLAMVGESGSGKSVTASALIGLVPGRAEVRGSVRLAGRELLGLDDREMSRVRGDRIGMVFQDPLAALLPVTSVGRQIAEAVRVHRRVSRAAALRRAVDLLDQVGIPDAARRARAFPYEFSGGMRQRVAIAVAIAGDPDLLIADEPTSALDTTVQAGVLNLLEALRKDRGCSLLLITHDLGVVARSCDRVAVMRDGRITEEGGVLPLLGAAVPAGHLGELLAATRDEERAAPAAPSAAGAPVLRVAGLRRHYRARQRLGRAAPPVRAVDGVSFTVLAGQSLALLGESGCGKTTTLHEILRLAAPQSGRIDVLGHDLSRLTPRDRRELRRQVQVVFQDPAASLDPRMRVGDIIAEPLDIQRASAAHRATRVEELLTMVELPPGTERLRPGLLSGGQRQRVAIARALATKPRLVLLDEPVSALDASLRVGMMRLLDNLRATMGLSYLLVSHDIQLVRRSADQVAVLYLGKVVEHGPAWSVLENPQHPYTRALVDASPTTDPARERSRERVVLLGDPHATPGVGCAFRPRCPLFPVSDEATRGSCVTSEPELRQTHPEKRQFAACHSRQLKTIIDAY